MNMRKTKKLWNNKNGFKTYVKLIWHEDFSQHLENYDNHMNKLSELLNQL